MASCRRSMLSPAVLSNIVELRDKAGMSFRDIATKLDIPRATVHRAYIEMRETIEDLADTGSTRTTPIVKRKATRKLPNALAKKSTALLKEAEKLAKTMATPLTESAPAVVVNLETGELSSPMVTPGSLVPVATPKYRIVNPTCPNNAVVEDEDLADKINLLIGALLGFAEKEAKLYVDQMEPKERIDAAVKLIDKMRLLGNKSTANVSTHNFVNLISKLTAEIRGPSDSIITTVKISKSDPDAPADRKTRKKKDSYGED